MLTTVKVSSQGQITLPQEILNHFGSNVLALKFELDEVRLKPINLDNFFQNDLEEDDKEDQYVKVKNTKHLKSILGI